MNKLMDLLVDLNMKSTFTRILETEFRNYSYHSIKLHYIQNSLSQPFF